MIDFERAKDKIMMGAERKSMVMSGKRKSSPPTTRPVMPLSAGWCQSTIQFTR